MSYGAQRKGRHSPVISTSCIIVLLLSISSLANAVNESGAEGSPDLYTLKIDLPPEVLYDVIVVDTLPSGLIFEPDSLSITGAASISSCMETINGSNDGSSPATITWNWDSVDNTADSDITIAFRAVVADASGNSDGAILSAGTATVNWRDAEGRVHVFSDRSKSVEVIEPDLRMERHFEPSIARAGETVVATLSLRHSSKSHADAFDVDLSEGPIPGLKILPGSGEIVSGPKGSIDESREGMLICHFDQIDRSWSGGKAVRLAYRGIVEEIALGSDGRGQAGGQTGSPEGERAAGQAAPSTLTWCSAPAGNLQRRIYSATYYPSSSLTIISALPLFNISLTDNPDPVRPGGQIVYAVSTLNRGGPAQNAVLSLDYDPGVDFLSADPSPDPGTDDTWTLGDMGRNATAAVRITVRANSSLSDGTRIPASARISCSQGTVALASVRTDVLWGAPDLFIKKTASSRLIRPGGLLNYAIEYGNSGPTALHNVTVTDIVDANLHVDLADVHPPPERVWDEEDGTVLLWTAKALDALLLPPNGSGRIDIVVSLDSDSVSNSNSNSALNSVFNRYRIDCDEARGSDNVLETFVVHSLYVKKWAEKQFYSAGEIINYTILYGNELIQPVDAKNARIYDTLPDLRYVEFLGADPRPTEVYGNVLFWNIGEISHGQSGRIQVYLRIRDNRSELSLRSRGSVSGQGYASVRQRLDSAGLPDSLTNYVNISDPVVEPVARSSSATITLSDALGTEVGITGHGSGEYKREDETRMLTENRSIQVSSSLHERHNATIFCLPQGRSIKYDSKWSEEESAKNRITGASISESYRYADEIERESSLIMDKNGTKLTSETAFTGWGHVGVTKERSDGIAAYSPVAYSPAVYSSSEDYIGSFAVRTSLDEYGGNVVANRSVSGRGFASSERSLGKSQGSYESGTGSYQAEELSKSHSGSMAKDLNVTFGPASYAVSPSGNITLSGKWREGMWSRSGTSAGVGAGGRGETDANPAGFISEQFTDALHLKKNTAFSGLGSMQSEAQFSGRAVFQAARRDSSSLEEEAIYSEYAGEYDISRRIDLGGVARYDRPHISLLKVGRMEPYGYEFAEQMSYNITVINDGNQPLDPVYVQDLFPEGTEYVSSTLRPSQITGSTANWTVGRLSVGSSAVIGLTLKFTDDADRGGEVVNSVWASGGWGGGWIAAANLSVLRRELLGCCPPQVQAAKYCYPDPVNPRLIHFCIRIKNTINSSLGVTITDHLPGCLQFQNSSIEFSAYRGDMLRWDLAEIRPEEVRTINYTALAKSCGAMDSCAEVTVYPRDGSGSASFGICSNISVGRLAGDMRATVGGEAAGGNGCEAGGKDSCTASEDGWTPPGCFGLGIDRGETSCDYACSMIELTDDLI